MMTSNRIFLAAGGTGGHIIPALAICVGLQEKGYNCEFLSDKRGKILLQKLAPEQKITKIASASPVSGSALKRAGALLQLLFGVGQSIAHIIRWRPLCVIGFGGYPSAPPIISANLFRIPSLLHEQNARIGRANLFLANQVKTLLLSWQHSTPLPAKTPIKVTGLPVRNAFFEIPDYRKKTEFTEEKPCHLLIIGGSLGAEIFARLIPNVISTLPLATRKNLCVTQQVRSEQQAQLEAHYNDLSITHNCAAFFTHMADEMSKADIIISRAGAASVSEIAAAGRASIFIPFPFALDDHQTANARSLTSENAAILLPQPEAEATPEILSNTLLWLMNNPQECKIMADKARSLANKNALNDIIEAITDCHKPSNGRAK